MHFYNPIHRHYLLIVVMLFFAAIAIEVISKYLPGQGGWFIVIWFVGGPLILRKSGRCQHCGAPIAQVQFFPSASERSFTTCYRCGGGYDEKKIKSQAR